MLILEVEHADGARFHHAACDKGAACDHEGIQRVAIGRQCVRHKTVIGWIAHRRMQDAVHEQSAAFLIKFILHRFAASGHFDDDIQIVRRIFAGGDFVDLHVKCLVASIQSRLPPSLAPGSGPLPLPSPDMLACRTIGGWEGERAGTVLRPDGRKRTRAP